VRAGTKGYRKSGEYICHFCPNDLEIIIFVVVVVVVTVAVKGPSLVKQISSVL
jgi:hypothetical protein